MLRLLLIAALVAAGPGLAGAETAVPRSRAEIALSFAPVVKRAAPAVVTIYTRKIVEDRGLPFAGDPFFERFFGDLFERMPQRQRVRTSLGSGVIVDPAGFVVSNHHVVAGADEITVRLSDRREYDGRVVLADERADLAVVRIEGADDLPALSLRDSDALEVGDLVLAIGDPFGVGQTVTSGIVSGLARQCRGGAGPSSRPTRRSTRAIRAARWSTCRGGWWACRPRSSAAPAVPTGSASRCPPTSSPA